ncbi:hypothetical protein [Hymenobacter tenuis]
MLNLRQSLSVDPSSAFVNAPRNGNEDNMEWIKHNIRQTKDGRGVNLLLVGGTQIDDFRVRVAQSHLRDDLTPSYWSHVALIEGGKTIEAETSLAEISLRPHLGFGFPPPSNGVQTGFLGTYQDARLYPNVALITVPVKQDVVAAALEKFQKQRSTLDTIELLLNWLAFVWGVGRTGNPLLAGSGLPSSAMIEVVMGAAGYDITPGLESRASCPEAIWQAAKWWHQYYQDQKHAPLIGAWHYEHTLV